MHESGKQIIRVSDGYPDFLSFQWAIHASFHSVVVITLASHARGPGFEPQWKQLVNVLHLIKYIFSKYFKNISKHLYLKK